MSAEVERVHATALAFSGRGVLLRGPSGSGKSDLALRCLAHRDAAAGHFFQLIADDQVNLTRAAQKLHATCPLALTGLLEVRGVGIIRVPALDTAPIVLVAELGGEGIVDRMPDFEKMSEYLGLLIPTIRLRAFEASAPHKIAAALAMSALPPVSAKP